LARPALPARPPRPPLPGWLPRLGGRLLPALCAAAGVLLPLQAGAGPAVPAEVPGEGAVGQGAASAWAWLDRMVRAARRLHYEGTFVYQRGESLVSMRLVHVGPPQGERERLVALNGERREVLRTEEGVVCLTPGRRLVKEGPASALGPLPGLGSAAQELAGHYRIEPRGGGRVAGREAQVLWVSPRDRYRYGYRLWLDRASGLLLRSQLVGDDGRVLEQVLFTSLELRPEPTAAMLAAVEAGSGGWEAAAEERVRTRRLDEGEPWPLEPLGLSWAALRPPPGFRVARRYLHRLEGGEGKGMLPGMLQVVLSDGLASVSVFVEPLREGEPAFHGEAAWGAVHAFGAVVDGHQLSVVGEVPAETVRLVGRSLLEGGGPRGSAEIDEEGR